MNSETIELLDSAITEIRIELAKGVDKEKLDLMLYELQIKIYKLEE